LKDVSDDLFLQDNIPPISITTNNNVGIDQIPQEPSVGNIDVNVS
jgi:hypothetical protein